ncbi:MAG: GspE/PulE family protein [Brevinematales bacterium]|nr:GspE/PulE family protein [Brevinematales bacterium]
MAKNLGDMLVQEGILDPAVIKKAIELQKKNHRKLGHILIEMGALQPDQLYHILEKQLGMPFVRSIEEPYREEAFHLLDIGFCRKHAIAPVLTSKGGIKVYTSEPMAPGLLNQISFRTGQKVEIAYATDEAIQIYLSHYEGKSPTSSSVSEDFVSDTEETPSSSPAVQLLQHYLEEAIRRKASDIHLEHLIHGVRVRFRIDGVLYEVDRPPEELYPALISRLKILSDLDISEKRLPQDGRITLPFEERQVDIRVSIIPTVNGENAVLRILDKGKDVLSLEEIGMPDFLVPMVKQAAERPYGMILVTGPTGSGKTTTLYGILKHISRSSRKILTIEDPVEYQMEGISQVQAHSEIGLTFAAGLRAFLRHDPDVIMVGEIRDKETADIAIRAALTGHLVLSTIHTNDAASTLTRFIDMEIPPYLLTSTIQLVLAQRLVRRLCPHCAHKTTLTTVEKQSHPWLEDLSFHWKPQGCAECHHTGFLGRIPLFEYIILNEKIKKAILNGLSSFELKEISRSLGMLTLLDHGKSLVKDGLTSIEEVEKVTMWSEA